ncbi:hypothetical protein PS627_04358 [Pseudomonas fluorescens]|uniref:O-antigen ligase family protein n=1 Tax=Pseudomonas fluorescens TaxID=294 RepID=UPI00125101DE|nr:O-antigen ligase family protein [Pseudomonas fluorescens]CAG8871227.1 hypothetical protein PS627_04358 [Pseudomonas fluorescens]
MTHPGKLFLRFLLAFLTLGFVVHIAGMLFITDGSRHTTISNATLFIPALILLIFDKPLRQSLLSRNYLLVGLLLTFTIAIALINSDSPNSASHQFKTALYVILYLSTINLLIREGGMEACLNILFIVSGATAVASMIVQTIALDQNIFVGGHRLFSLGYEEYANFKNPIIAALYYAFFAIYGFYQLLTKRYSRITNVLFSACVLGLTLYLYCTFARGVWLAYSVTICTIALLHHSERSRRWLIATAVLTVATAITLLPVLTDQYSRGLSLRDIIWKGWLERLGEFWLIGAGAGRRFEICIAADQCFSQAHNLFLQFFYEFGIIGFVLLVCMLIGAFRQSLNRRARAMPLGSLGLPLLIFSIITAMFDYHTVLNRPGVYWLIFWLPIGLILSTQLKRGSQDKSAPIKTGILSAAKRYWHIEIIGSLDKPFSWKKIFQKCRQSNRYRYIFWYRLAYVLHAQGNKFWRRRGKLLNEKISRKFNVEIMMGATVGEGLWIAHPTGIVITSHAYIGKNFKIWQNCTIGIKGQHDNVVLVIGDGVRVHAHSCIISDNLTLGDNVVVGAGSFLNKSVPSGHVAFNARTSIVREYDVNSMGRLQH